MAKAASLGAVAMNNVTELGAPSYTSGIHMWNGTRPSLKASPLTMNTRPNTSTVRLELVISRVRDTVLMSSDPVAP